MKCCTECHIEKELSEFPFKHKATGKKHAACKACYRKKGIAHYKSNKISYKRRAKKFNKNRRNELREIVFQYLLQHKCVDCNETDVRTLDFDHRSGKKLFTISQLVKRATSIKSLIKEIEKCEVRCANCHRKRTFKDFGYYKHARMVELADTSDLSPDASA